MSSAQIKLNKILTNVSTKSVQQQANIHQNNQQQKSLFAKNRPNVYEKILNKLSTQKHQETIYTLASHDVFEHLGQNIYMDCQITLIQQSKIDTQVLFGFAKINNFQIPFKILIQNQNSCYGNKINEGSFGSIYEFDKQLIVKKIYCQWPQIKNIELRIINLQETLKEKQAIRQIISHNSIFQEELKNIKQNIQRLQIKKKQFQCKFINQVKTVIQEYCILKFCSALKVGPTLPNIVFEIILYQDCLCFFMEKCQININSNNSQQNIINDLKDNLQLMHYFKLIHFDIKPVNILYSFNYKKFVFADFGLSRFAAKEVGNKEKMYYFQGTLAYCTKQMKQLYLRKKPLYIDLYENDWHGLEVTIKQIGQNRRLLMFKNQFIERLSEEKKKLSIKQELQQLKFCETEKVKKLNHIKLKIIQRDFQYLEQKNYLLKYFSHKLKIFVKEIQLKFEEKQFLAFAMKLNEDIFGLSSQLKIQQCWHEPLLSCKKFNKSDVMETHGKLKNDNKTYECILSFLSCLHLIFSEKWTFYFFLIQESIEKLIEVKQIVALFKQKVQVIKNRLKSKEISKFSGKQIAEKIEQVIYLCFELIINYLKHTQAQIKNYILEHMTYLSLTSCLDVQIFLPIQIILQSFPLDFYVKAQLIWVLHTKQKNFTFLQRGHKQDFFQCYFHPKQLETQKRKSLIIVLQQLFIKLQQAKQYYHHFNNENQMEDITQEILNMIEKLKWLKVSIESIFSIKYYKYKLYYILQSLAQICVDWPEINTYVRKALTEFKFCHYLYQIAQKSKIILAQQRENIGKVVKNFERSVIIETKRNIKYYTVQKVFNKFQQLLQGYKFFPNLYDKHILCFAPTCKFVEFNTKSLLHISYKQKQIRSILKELYLIFKEIIGKINRPAYKQYQYYLQIYLFVFEVLQNLKKYLKDSKQSQKIWQTFKKKHKTTKNYDLLQFQYNYKDFQIEFDCQSQAPKYYDIQKFQYKFKDMRSYLLFKSSVISNPVKPQQICSLWILDNFRIEMMMLNRTQFFQRIIQTLKQGIQLKTEVSKQFLWKNSEQYPSFHKRILRCLLKQVIKRKESCLFLQILCSYYETKVYHLNNQDIFNFPLNICSEMILTINNMIEFFNYKDQFYRQLLQKLTWKFYECNKKIACFLFPMHLKLLELCNQMPSYQCTDKNQLYNMCRISIFSPFKNIFKYHLYCYLVKFHSNYNLRDQYFCKRLMSCTAQNWDIYKPHNVMQNIKKIFLKKLKYNKNRVLERKVKQKITNMIHNVVRFKK